VVSPNYGGKEGKNTSLATPFTGACRQSRPDIAGGAHEEFALGRRPDFPNQGGEGRHETAIKLHSIG
jgi:hypothetical protein